MVPQRMVSDDASISNTDSSTSTSVEVDAKEPENTISTPKLDFNSLRDGEVLEWWRTH